MLRFLQRIFPDGLASNLNGKRDFNSNYMPWKTFWEQNAVGMGDAFRKLRVMSGTWQSADFVSNVYKQTNINSLRTL